MNKHFNFIANRMNELGFSKFNMKSLRVNIESGQQIERFNAHNEFLYLVNESIPGDLIIHSDSNLFFSSAPQSGSFIPQEFSGLICIESSSVDPFQLEFIRVIPA